MPQVLKELMRHESIETTMRYYVGQNAERTAAAVYEAYHLATGPESADSCGLAGGRESDVESEANFDWS